MTSEPYLGNEGPLIEEMTGEVLPLALMKRLVVLAYFLLYQESIDRIAIINGKVDETHPDAGREFRVAGVVWLVGPGHGRFAGDGVVCVRQREAQQDILADLEGRVRLQIEPAAA